MTFVCLADIHEGNLKAILTLFFNVSRYKQSLKQNHQQQPQLQQSGTPSGGGYSSDTSTDRRSRVIRFVSNSNPNHQHQATSSLVSPSAAMISR
mgnify:CR=1 FL=1